MVAVLLLSLLALRFFFPSFKDYIAGLEREGAVKSSKGLLQKRGDLRAVPTRHLYEKLSMGEGTPSTEEAEAG